MFGIININKPKDFTSFDVIAKLRKILKEKRIGHTGTLDPNATGVLPICIGTATKFVSYILNEDKQYLATMKLGIKTDSGDITGKIIEEKEIGLLTLDLIKTVALKFIGKQKQLPPMYSAIKKDGKKLYELARQGIEIERELRDIEIYNISNIIYNSNEQIVEFLVDCSKGTYIRSLCEDIAIELNTVGTLMELQRTKTGLFTLDSSYTLEQIEQAVKTNTIESHFINIEEIFADFKSLIVDEENMFKFLNGVKLEYQVEDGDYRIYNSINEFLGLGIVKDNKLKRNIII